MPIVNQIVLVNVRVAKAREYRGLGKRLLALVSKHWHADAVAESKNQAYRGHSIAGPGIAEGKSTDTQHQSNMSFAHEILDHLRLAFSAREFDRLLAVKAGEIAKDLSAQPTVALENHIGEVIAV